MIVDSHVHLWDVDRNPQPWITDEISPLARTFGPDELHPLLAAAGIDSRHRRPGRLPRLRHGLPLRRRGSARVDRRDHGLGRPPRPAEGGGAPRAARRRRGSSAPSATSCTSRRTSTGSRQPAVLESLGLLEELGLILEVPVVFPQHFGDVGLVAARFPQLRIVVDHLGKPPLGMS